MRNRLLRMASTSPRRRWRLICASCFYSINSAVSEGLDRGLEVGMLSRLRIKIRASKNDIANKTKTMSSELQYASSHAANYVTVKRVIEDMGMIADAKWQTRTNLRIQNCGIRTSLVNFIVWRQCNEGQYFDGVTPPGRAAESKPMQQTRVSVGLVITAAAKCEIRLRLTIIELSYRYRNIFDLSYRLSVYNSIWHILTALVLTVSWYHWSTVWCILLIHYGVMLL